MSVAAGELVFRRGDEDDALFLVAQGAVEIVESQHGEDALVSVINTNQYFGEWEAIFREPRVYGARARTDCLLYTVSGERFRRVLREWKRQRALGERKDNKITTVRGKEG